MWRTEWVLWSNEWNKVKKAKESKTGIEIWLKLERHRQRDGSCNSCNEFTAITPSKDHFLSNRGLFSMHREWMVQIYSSPISSLFSHCFLLLHKGSSVRRAGVWQGRVGAGLGAVGELGLMVFNGLTLLDSHSWLNIAFINNCSGCADVAEHKAAFCVEH